MSMNLGLESLAVAKQSAELDADSFIAMQCAIEDLQATLAEGRSAIDGFKNLCGVIDTVHKHGAYAGFEELVAEKQQLASILGCDICSASTEEIEDMVSSEILRDTINKFLSKINAFFGKMGDKINNFIKTTLPFKEKYLKEMTDLKTLVSNLKINEEKFAEMKVSSAMTKAKFNETIKQRKQFFDSLMEACKLTTEGNLENLLLKAEEFPDALRTSFGTYIKYPWHSWFQTGKVKDLGWSGKDVIPVLESSIKEIESIVELNTMFAKMANQVTTAAGKISQLRATGKDEEAGTLRENIARVQEFFWQMWEAAAVYDSVIRREMYFATYLGRAAKKAAM